MSSKFCAIFCTCPDQETAKKLALELVEQELAACVNIIPQILSIYKWHANIESSPESLMMIKSTYEAYERIERLIHSLHPNDCPEIICLDIKNGSKIYLEWMSNTVS